MLQRTVEQILDESVVVERSVPHERVRWQTAEHTLDESISQIMEESVEVVKTGLQERFLRGFVSVDISVPHVDVQDIMLPDKKEIAEARQLMTKVSECQNAACGEKRFFSYLSSK